MPLQRKPSFSDSDSLKTNLKNSLFEKLFPLRKGLFEKFPSANKGLAFSGPGIKLGSTGTFTFTTNETSDKVDFKDTNGVQVLARYKKDAKLFDVSLRGKCNNVEGLTYLVKYEERKENAPHYVFGVDYFHKKSGFQNTMKVNPLTTKVKVSLLHPGGKCGIPEGLRFAADSMVFLNQLSKPETITFNVGVAYDNPLGLTGVSYNHRGDLTLTHIKKLDDVTLGVEVGQSVKGNEKSPKMPLVAVASYQFDSNTVVRAKINKDLAVNLGIKRDFSKNLNVSLGTTVELQKPMLQAPAFGFKVTMKA
eukprot:GEMP01011087.1.p1 GENE.GEMP01011087.1~~GEMP01011087.1.p1  ORF type:complete len:306 (+),score=95.86 GEMP01011087.1:72-989(+)